MPEGLHSLLWAPEGPQPPPPTVVAAACQPAMSRRPQSFLLKSYGSVMLSEVSWLSPG